MGEKWRCWMNQTGHCGWIREGEPLPRETKWVGVHSFSERLDLAQDLERVKCWGGLQLIGERVDSKCLQVFRKKIAQFVLNYAVPLSSIEYYETTKGYEAYIPGRLFRSAGVRAHQLEVDDNLRLKFSFVKMRLSPLDDPECYGITDWTQNVDLEKLFDSYPDKVSSPVKIINDIPVYFSMCEDRQGRRLSSRKFWGNEICLGAGYRHVGGIPLLAAVYDQRKKVIVSELLLSCPIYKEAVADWAALDKKEKETIAWIGHGVGLNEEFYPELQQVVKSLHVSLKNKSGEWTYEGILEGCVLRSCSDVVLKCKNGDDRVCRSCKARGQSPRALSVFVPHTAECALQPEGVFAQQPEPKKISGPIWVHTRFESKEGETLGYELFFMSSDGQFKSLIVTVEDFSKPVLFSSLINNGMRLPKSKTLRGELRYYLRYQEPMRTEIQVLEGGWQSDGSFAMLSPSSDGVDLKVAVVCASSDFLQDRYEWNFLDEDTEAYRNNRAFARFIRAASYSATLLENFKLDGVCIHFYGGSRKQRLNVARYASSLWNAPTGGCGYSVENALKHVNDIKRCYQDQAVCIVNVSRANRRKYQSFLRRFLVGRAGYDSGTRAVVISVGKDSLVTKQEAEQVGEVYQQDGKLLGICLDLDLFRQVEYASLSFKLASAEMFIEKVVQKEQRFTQDNTAEEWARSFARRNVSSLVPTIWKMLYVAFKNMLGQGTVFEGRKNFKVVMQIAEEWRQGPFPWRKELSNLGRYLNNSRSRMRFLRAYDVLVGRKRCLFFPANDYREALGVDQGQLAKFSRWLIKNKVLITDSYGRASRVRYISERRKSVRGYVIDKQKLKRFLNK